MKPPKCDICKQPMQQEGEMFKKRTKKGGDAYNVRRWECKTPGCYYKETTYSDSQHFEQALARRHEETNKRRNKRGNKDIYGES